MNDKDWLCILYRPDVQLIGGSSEGIQQPVSDVEMDDVQFNPRLEEVLNNEQWVDDATWVYIHYSVFGIFG